MSENQADKEIKHDNNEEATNEQQEDDEGKNK